MPLYEYECGACGHRFEVIQKFSDSPIEQCPLCAEPVHKLLSAPAIQFKGTGWYVTDYASKRNTEAATDASLSKSEGSKGAPSTGAADSSKPDSGKTSSSDESGSSKPATAGGSSADRTDSKSGKSLPE